MRALAVGVVAVLLFAGCGGGDDVHPLEDVEGCRYLAGPEVWECDSYAGLRGLDLAGADLTDTNLEGADLSYSILKDADLTGADLTDADLTDADLRDANLSYADLTGANLFGADLTNADLFGADLTGANQDYMIGFNTTVEDWDSIKGLVTVEIVLD